MRVCRLLRQPLDLRHQLRASTLSRNVTNWRSSPQVHLQPLVDILLSWTPGPHAVIVLLGPEIQPCLMRTMAPWKSKILVRYNDEVNWNNRLVTTSIRITTMLWPRNWRVAVAANKQQIIHEFVSTYEWTLHVDCSLDMLEQHALLKFFKTASTTNFLKNSWIETVVLVPTSGGRQLPISDAEILESQSRWRREAKLWRVRRRRCGFNCQNWKKKALESSNVLGDSGWFSCYFILGCGEVVLVRVLGGTWGLHSFWQLWPTLQNLEIRSSPRPPNSDVTGSLVCTSARR